MEWVYCLIMWFNDLMIQNTAIAIIVTAAVTAFAMFLVGRALDNRRQEKKIKGLYQALYEELKEIQNTYLRDVEIHWKGIKEGAEQIFRVNLSLTQDYSTIYHANANLIGEIPDPHLRRKIVKTYTSLKVIIDYYKQNNRTQDEYEKYYERGPSIEELAYYENKLADFTQLLYSRHLRFVRLNKLLLKTLEELKPNERFWEQQ